VGLIFENLSYLTDELTSGSAGSSFDAAKTLCETPLTLPAINSNPQFYDPTIPYTTWNSIPGMGLPASPSYTDFGISADIFEPLNCINTVDANVTAKMRRIIRRMIASTDMGFGGVSGGATCGLTNVSADFDYTAGMPPTITATPKSECCPLMVTP
jgi:hypothetical protein